MTAPSRQEQRHNCAENAITSFNPITFEDTKETFIYNVETGFYEPGETKIETFIQNFFLEETSKNDINETLGIIRRKTYIQREEIEQETKNLIPLKNGVFDFKKKELIPYSKEHKMFYKHPIQYNSAMDCPKIKEFINQITENNTQKQDKLWKMLAYCFWREYIYQHAFMLIGKGSNGKSTLFKLLTKALGENQISNVTLQDLTADKFSLADLHEKNANIFADIPKKTIKITGSFKALTGDADRIRAQKKHKDSFHFYNFAKLVFSCNQLPKTEDKTDAFYRRWVIIPFGKQFLNSEKKPGLLKELTTKEELSGFFNESARHLQEFIEQNGFPDNIEETREFYEKSADISAAFCYDCLELNLDGFEKKEQVWQNYLVYCKENDAIPDTEKAFYQALYNHFDGKAYSSRRLFELGYDRVWIIVGIKFREKKEEKP